MSARPVGHLDKQLEQLLTRLRAADGDPVSFDELRAQGIENPALLCYELEVAGVPLERTHRDGGGAGPPIAVQLDEGGLRENTQPMSPAELPDAPGERLRTGLERTRVLLADTREEAADLAARAAGAVRTLAGEGRADESPRRPPPNGAPRPARPPAPSSGGRGRGAVARRGLEYRRVVALVALVLACATVLTVVLANVTSSSGGRAGAPATRRAKAKAVQSAAAAQPPKGAPATTSAAGASPPGAQQSPQASSPSAAATPAPKTASTPTTPPAQAAPPVGATATAGASPQTAASLQAQGHQLLAEGHFPQAINQLRAAADASGGSVARCAEPSSDACLTYAYALYDLGRALRLDGQSASALAVLGERVQIDNQRPVVESEIALARGANAAAGGGTQAAPSEPTAASPPRPIGRRRAHADRSWGHTGRPVRRAGGLAAGD